MNNTIYLRRRSKIVLPATTGGDLLPLHYVATALKNIEALGYSFSERLINACRTLSKEQLVALYQELVTDLKRFKGDHQTFAPMYPNFPAQVMEMSKGELYFNAIIHYLTGGKLFPRTEVKERFPLLDNVDLTIIDLGSLEDFETLFAQIAGSNTSLSEQDKEDLTWFVSTYGDRIGTLLPAEIPQKENMAFLAGLLLKYTSEADSFVSVYCKTATDVLRLAVALSAGDVSLATNTKFRTFSRKERTLFLGLVERQGNRVEDMLRYKGRWIRLGEKLHPGEYASRFPEAVTAFDILRNDKPFTTFNSTVEQALSERRVAQAVIALHTRPGDFARRLDHLLRQAGDSAGFVLQAFSEVVTKVSTPVLLQVMHHFTVRNDRDGLRVFFPKGNLAKAQGIENTLPALPEDVCEQAAALCKSALEARFSTLPELGKVYVDPALRDYKVPFAMRSASKSLRTLVRGSKLPLPEGPVLRFFVWWKNGAERTDIDLSAAMFNADFQYVDVLSYYNLEGFGGAHSGDIVDAPDGASEFIDVTLDNLRETGSRYIVMILNSYTHQPFVELPECFAGWMARQEPESGEIFEPKTVKDRLDITADTKISIPLIIDVVENKAIWCDMALKNHPKWQNNVEANKSGVQVTLRSFTDLKKPNLYELFLLHAEARGELVETPEEADTVFSVENETPFRLEEIASEYMG